MKPMGSDRDPQRSEDILRAYARATEVEATPELRARLLAALDRELVSSAPASIPARFTMLVDVIGALFAARRLRAVALAVATVALIGAGLVLAGAAGRLQLPWSAPLPTPGPTLAPVLVPAIVPEATESAEPWDEATETEAAHQDATETERADGDEADDDATQAPEATEDKQDDDASPTDDGRDDGASPTDDGHDNDGAGPDSGGEDQTQE